MLFVHHADLELDVIAVFFQALDNRVDIGAKGVNCNQKLSVRSVKIVKKH